MQAYVLHRYGGPEAWEPREVPRPVPKRGELLVKVHAAGLNPVDYKTREGMLRPIVDYTLPIVAGNELAGVVEEVGEGVEGFAGGEAVFARVDKQSLGAFAEYAAVRADLVATKPPSLDFVSAAGAPLAGVTALQALRDELQVAPGQRIFISGGAGGVGTFAIQIAKGLGAEVTTTASARGADLVRSLGADQVVDYATENWEATLRDFDGAFDLIGGDSLLKTFRVVKRGAKVVSIAGMPEPTTAQRDLHAGGMLAAAFWVASLRIRVEAWRYGATYRYLFMRESGADLSDLATLLGSGRLRVVLDRVYPFAQIAEAMRFLEEGHAKGKVVVQMK